MLKHTKNGNYYETLEDAISEELTEIDTETISQVEEKAKKFLLSKN